MCFASLGMHDYFLNENLDPFCSSTVSMSMETWSWWRTYDWLTTTRLSIHKRVLVEWKSLRARVAVFVVSLSWWLKRSHISRDANSILKSSDSCTFYLFTRHLWLLDFSVRSSKRKNIIAKTTADCQNTQKLLFLECATAFLSLEYSCLYLLLVVFPSEWHSLDRGVLCCLVHHDERIQQSDCVLSRCSERGKIEVVFEKLGWRQGMSLTLFAVVLTSDSALVSCVEELRSTSSSLFVVVRDAISSG